MLETDEPGCILLVDDNPMDIELTLDAFEQAHLSNPVVVIDTGEAAIAYLLGQGEYADRATHPLPAVVLLDLKMPRVDGFEVLRRVKSSPIARRIPVIVMTSSREEGDRALSYDHGANSYVVKPVAFDGFLKVVGLIRDYWLTLNVGPPVR